ncbi:pyridoxal kinase PdxY [Paramagnetospirillum kuznetsovii]|uniref:pyridoxal kinase n=1 Tax=Paramagnetospirillum kuznetsovii TaxID=2053833 RepID=A0A364P3J8_9PROT|nr:pyridoxal kinase PdxY [Paramagnetospirillum kuznetsovii]RAU23922.1 pyridoxal kinase PdxY [Paramagnetospirillum kuznetsovii]
MQILSFQSAVAYGHVGNSAAVFPLQRLGFDVWPVDTVQFSNHPGHGRWSGGVMGADHLNDVVGGLEDLGLLKSCDGILSGYLGRPKTGDAVLRAASEIRMANPKALFLCDPVMGDDGPGLYVKPGIPEILAERLVPAADVVTPNRFELAHLTGLPVGNLPEAVTAARHLMESGPAMVVVTSLPTGENMVACAAVTKDGAWAVRTPTIAFPTPPNGAGDVLSALLLGHLLRGEDLPEALSMAVSSLYGILAKTREQGRRELALIAAQDEIALPSRFFAPLSI